MLQYIHSLGTTTETIIALEYVLLKLYDPKPVNKGSCNPVHKVYSAVDTMRLKSQGHYFGNEVV